LTTDYRFLFHHQFLRYYKILKVDPAYTESRRSKLKDYKITRAGLYSSTLVLEYSTRVHLRYPYAVFEYFFKFVLVTRTRHVIFKVLVLEYNFIVLEYFKMYSSTFKCTRVLLNVLEYI